MHIGRWFMTKHSAFGPHEPGQGFWHLFLIHALLDAQSVLSVHSYLHPSYGFPSKPGRQLQEPAPFCSLQIALAPHGEGSHGDKYSMGTGSAK